jgi:hypothetical protein
VRHRGRRKTVNNVLLANYMALGSALLVMLFTQFRVPLVIRYVLMLPTRQQGRDVVARAHGNGFAFSPPVARGALPRLLQHIPITVD